MLYRRFISVLLLIGLIFSLTACDDSAVKEVDGDIYESNDSSQTTTELSEDELYPLPDTDMEGFIFSIYNYDDTYVTWAINTIDVEELTGEIIDDEIYNRNRRIEQKYNAKIDVTAVSRPTDNFAQLMRSGDDSFDMVMIYDEMCANYYCEGMLQTWDFLRYVDMERSWWNQDANNVFQIKGNQYAAVGDFSLVMYSRGFALVFNKDMYADLMINESPYDLVRTGAWTVDKFTEIAKQATADINGDNVLDDKDRYGAAGAVKLTFGSLVTGAGIKYISTDEEGNPYFAIPGNTYAFDVFEKIFNLFDGSNIFYYLHKEVHSGSTEATAMFLNNQTLFHGSSIKGFSNLRDSKFDIGFLPFPKYDEKQERYYTLTSGAEVSTIPITLTAERADNVGILLDAMCRDSQKSLVPKYQDVVLKIKYTRDEDSAEMLDIIFDSTVFDLGLSVWPDVTYYKYMEIYLNMNNKFASLTASLEPQVNKKIETMLKTLEESNG